MRMKSGGRRKITPAQIKLIKVLQRRAGLDDDGYREMLAGVAG